MIQLVSCPQMEHLARRIGRVADECETVPVDWGSFRDGFPDLRVPGMSRLRNNDVVFLASFDTPGDIFTQLALIYEIPRYAVRSFKLMLPYFPTGTMERVDEDGQIATAATLARMLSSIPTTISGPAQVVIYDIHALQERFYFSDQVIPRLESAVPLLKRRIRSLPDVSVAFPDEGAAKRFGPRFDDYPQIVCSKVREDERRVVRLKEGDAAGRRVVIVDDLVMTGGTLIEARRALMQAGAAEVSAFTTHGVLPGDCWKRFVDAGFARFWITDSCPRTAATVDGVAPFEILSLDEPLAELLPFGA